MEFWQQLLILTLTPTTVVVAVTYILRKFFDQSLARDLEKFKAYLQIKRAEFQTRFSLLHEKRVQVIGELFARLSKASGLATDLMHPFQFIDSVRTLQVKKNETWNAFQELNNYFQMHRIYLDKSVCDKMDFIVRETTHALNNFGLAQKGTQYGPDTTGLWDKSWDKLEKEVTPLLAELEKQFRDLMDPQGGKTA